MLLSDWMDKHTDKHFLFARPFLSEKGTTSNWMCGQRMRQTIDQWCSSIHTLGICSWMRITRSTALSPTCTMSSPSHSMIRRTRSPRWRTGAALDQTQICSLTLLNFSLLSTSACTSPTTTLIGFNTLSMWTTTERPSQAMEYLAHPISIIQWIVSWMEMAIYSLWTATTIASLDLDLTDFDVWLVAWMHLNRHPITWRIHRVWASTAVGTSGSPILATVASRSSCNRTIFTVVIFTFFRTDGRSCRRFQGFSRFWKHPRVILRLSEFISRTSLVPRIPPDCVSDQRACCRRERGSAAFVKVAAAWNRYHEVKCLRKDLNKLFHHRHLSSVKFALSVIVTGKI